MTKEEFSRLREGPSIVHYTTHVKPWLYAAGSHTISGSITGIWDSHRGEASGLPTAISARL